MTDKEQIIINGVDVSKCDRLIVNQLYGYACNCEEDTHIISSCKNYSRHNRLSERTVTMSKHYVKIKGLATLTAELSNNKTETINTLVTGYGYLHSSPAPIEGMMVLQ